MSSGRCAACKYLRRRCGEDCVLAPYFPSSHPERFACVHRIFGASNVSRMLQQLPVEQRSTAADTISTEAYFRVQDPVYGIVGLISLRQQEIFTLQRQLAETQAQIALISSTTGSIGASTNPFMDNSSSGSFLNNNVRLEDDVPDFYTNDENFR